MSSVIRHRTCDGPPGRAWYLVYCKPRQEITALENLQRQGYTCYLPLCRQRRRRAGKFVTMVESLFPRYLFISLDRENDNWAPIRSTRGVLSLVRFGNRVASVPDALVDGIRLRDDEAGLQALPEKEFKRGDAVRIMEGSMAGLEAIFLARTGGERVMVLMHMLGTQARVEVDSVLVEAVA